MTSFGRAGDPHLKSGATPHNTAPRAESGRIAVLDEAGIHMLVHRFYARVRSDASLGPIFDTAIGDAWEAHLAKMCDFWASVALGAKRYKGNVQLAHMPLRGIEPAHFSRWLLLFLDTAEQLFDPAAAVRVMEPALRIAESLQLSRFGWNYQVPPEQKALLERVAPRRPGRDTPH